MIQPVKKVFLYPNMQKTHCARAVAGVTEKLRSLGMLTVMSDNNRAILDADIYLPEYKAFEESDIAVVLGGDGTMLSAAHIACETDTPLLGINLGTLGYMSELEISDIDLLDKLLGDVFYNGRMMLTVSACRKGEAVTEYTALNEAIISRGAVASMVGLSLNCDGALVNDYRADGLIISTPTGSSAYSMSAGGPIIDPKLDAFCVCPICSHSLAGSRALLFSPRSEIEVTPFSEKGGDIILTVDGRYSFPLEDGDSVIIKKSKKTTRFIKLKKDAFYTALKRKLG